MANTENRDDKPRTEVIEETRETLSVLELDRKPRPEKLAAERSFFDGAHEVRFTERSFRPKHGADLDAIRNFVDSLEIRRREIPALPTLEPAVHSDVRHQVPDHYRAPLERIITGSLVSVETVHRVGTGTVVDVAWESRDGSLQRGLYLVSDDTARPYEDVTARVDKLAGPSVPDEPPVAGSNPPTVEPEAEKKRTFGFGRKKAEEAPAPNPPATDEPKKRRFGFGRK